MDFKMDDFNGNEVDKGDISIRIDNTYLDGKFWVFKSQCCDCGCSELLFKVDAETSTRNKPKHAEFGPDMFGANMSEYAKKVDKSGYVYRCKNCSKIYIKHTKNNIWFETDLP